MSEANGNVDQVLEKKLMKESEMSEEKEAPRKLSRREFVKGAAVGAAGAAAVGGLASCAPAATPAPTAPPEAMATTAPAAAPTAVAEEWDYETDVVVVGSGMGGLSAGIRAAEEGAQVIMVEISSTTGGGASFSGGVIHISGLTDYEKYSDYTEGIAGRVLGEVYYKTGMEYLAWLFDIGTSVSGDPASAMVMMGQGEKHPMNCRAFFDSFVSIFEEAGGTILLNTRALKILTDEMGTIAGLRCIGSQGILNIKAKAVALACGGFQNNPEMRVRYYGYDADQASILATPYNMGDGMKMAQELGATLSDSFGTFMGSWGPAFPATNPSDDPEEYEKRPYTPEGKGDLAVLNAFTDVVSPTPRIYVNIHGKRFIDEDSKNYRPAQATIRQRQSKAYLIYDKTANDAIIGVEDWLWSPRTWEDKVALVEKYGGVLVMGDTLGELADKINEFKRRGLGIHKANFLKTMDEYNAAVEAGTTADLDVPRTNPVAKIETPPFYAIPIAPRIYLCAGGVRINENAQVLDMQLQPIPGLYACPPTAGGVMREIYVGGNCVAGTFGYIAGPHAASFVETS